MVIGRLVAIFDIAKCIQSEVVECIFTLHQIVPHPKSQFLYPYVDYYQHLQIIDKDVTVPLRDSFPSSKCPFMQMLDKDFKGKWPVIEAYITFLT